MPTLTTTMHKTVTDYAVPRQINIHHAIDRIERHAVDGHGTEYVMPIHAGYYYLTNAGGYVTHVSFRPTAESAVRMMKRHIR